MAVSNNPAGRLHALLREGQSKQKDKPASEIWAEILNVPKEDTGLLLRRVGHVMTLPSGIKEAMSYVDDLDHSIYLRWLPRVEASFSILNFQMAWKQFIERFDGEVMYGIEICSDRLSRDRPEKVADESLLESLLKKVNDLLGELESIDVEPGTWFFIYDNLVKIKEAIEEYKVQGIKPLEAVFEQTIGEVVLTPEKYQSSQKTEKGQKFWEVMGYLALVVTITAGTIQIGKDAVSILPPPEEESTEQPENRKNDASEPPSESEVIET